MFKKKLLKIYSQTDNSDTQSTQCTDSPVFGKRYGEKSTTSDETCDTDTGM